MPESFTLPEGARMTVVRSGADQLEVRTPNKLWWPGPLWMLGIAGLYVLTRPFPDEESVPHGPGLVAFIVFAEMMVVLLTAYLSTHQWLRIANGTLEYQLRLGPRTLTSRRVKLADIKPIDSMSDESDSGGNAWAYIVTANESFAFGNELTTTVIDSLIVEIMWLRDPSEPWPPSLAHRPPAKTVARIKRRQRK